jgi:hypothetical protein
MDLESQAMTLAQRLQRNSAKDDRGAGGYLEATRYWGPAWRYMRRWIDDHGCLPSGEHVVPQHMPYPDRRRHIVRWGPVLKIDFTKLQDDPEYSLADGDHLFVIPARYRQSANQIKLSAAQARVLQLMDALTDGPWPGHRFKRLPRRECRRPTLMTLLRLGLIERADDRMGGCISNPHWRLSDAGRAEVARLPPLGPLPPEYTRIGPFWFERQSPPPSED